MMDAQRITEQLRGQWHGSYGTAPCPVCQPEGRRDQCGLSLKDGDGLLLAHCFKDGCDFKDIAAAIDLPPGRVSFDIEAAQAGQAKAGGNTTPHGWPKRGPSGIYVGP